MVVQKNNASGFQISYKWLIISLMILLSSIAIVDRFTTNFWPLYLNQKTFMIKDDWSATTFFLIAWIFGRELIISSSFIYLTQCKCLMNYIFEHKPSWLKCDDIHIINYSLHYHIGWLAIGLPIIIHIWLVFLPLIRYPINNIHIYYQQWMRPIDEHTNFYLENYHHHTVNIALNDIYALIAMTFCFCFLFPLSLNHKIRKNNYNFSQYFHLLSAAIYTVELLRTPFTVHCWFVCTPVIVLYIIDRIIGLYYYRATNETKLICKYNIDRDYVVLFLHVPGLDEIEANTPKCKSSEGNYISHLGNVFYLNTKKYLQYKNFSHPFTTFLNHSNKLYGNIEKSLLFSPTMRSALSHRGHRFPIRTTNKQQHVTFDEFQLNKQNIKPKAQYDMLRTDTTISAMSFGRALNQKKMTSASESAAKYIRNKKLYPKNIRFTEKNDHNNHNGSNESLEINATILVGATVAGNRNTLSLPPSVNRDNRTDSQISMASSITYDSDLEMHNNPFHGTPGLNTWKSSMSADTHQLYLTQMHKTQILNENDEIIFRSKPLPAPVAKNALPITKTAKIVSIPVSNYNDNDDDQKSIQCDDIYPHKLIKKDDPNLWFDEKIQVNYKWNVGVLMRVHHTRNGKSFTKYIADQLGVNDDDIDTVFGTNDSSDGDTCNPYTGDDDDDDCYKATHIYTYGPYRSAFGNIISEVLINNNPSVLIATGAGVSYILDFLFYTRANKIKFKSRVNIHFSCRSVKLFQWVTDVISPPNSKFPLNLYVNAHLTSHKNINQHEYDLNKKTTGKIGRASFESVLRNSIVYTKVFFCGSPFIQNKIKKICKELNFKLYQSHSFA